MTDKKNPSGVPDLDLDFTHHASDKMRRVDVSKAETFEDRLKYASPKFKESVEDARIDLDDFKEKKQELALKKAAAERTENNGHIAKIDRQITHNDRMIASRTQELEGAYYVGEKGVSLDARNEHSKNGLGRTDLISEKIVDEKTTAVHKKKSAQIDAESALAKETGRKLVVDAPNMNSAGVRHAYRHGADRVTQSSDETHRFYRDTYRDKSLLLDEGGREKVIASVKEQIRSRVSKAEPQVQRPSQENERSQEQIAENKEQKGVRIELFAGENKQAKKVLNAQTGKAEINTALENKGVGKINGTDKARFEAIRDRAEQKAVEQGASPDVVKDVALNKLYGVMARYEQMKDRARVYEKPTKKEADSHMHRANDLNDKIIETRKQNAVLTGQSYTGSQPKSEEHKQAFASHGSYVLRSRAKLVLVRADLENEGKYEEEKERIEKNIAKNKTIDLGTFEREHSHKNDQSEQYGTMLANIDNVSTQYAQYMAQTQKGDEQAQGNSKSFGENELSM